MLSSILLLGAVLVGSELNQSLTDVSTTMGS